MAYQPEGNYNTANYNPNDVPQVDTRDYYAQAEQKAAYQNQTNADLNSDYWKNALSGARQQGIGGTSGIGSALIGKPIPTKRLQDEADRVRGQSEQLINLVDTLKHQLFEPSLNTKAAQGAEKDNPSSIEGNLQRATSNLQAVIFILETALAKIGGR